MKKTSMEWRVPFGDLVVKDEALSHLTDCVRNNRVSGGIKTKILEEEICSIM